jgi:hypothetical protein
MTDIIIVKNVKKKKFIKVDRCKNKMNFMVSTGNLDE